MEWILLFPFFFFISTTVLFFFSSWFRTHKILKFLSKQAIHGPPPSSFLFGNIPEMKKHIMAVENTKSRAQKDKHSQPISHDYLPKLFPQYHVWTQKYGKVFVFRRGMDVFVYVMEPGLLKDIILSKSMDQLGVGSFVRRERGALLGRGIFTSNGEDWVQQRKVIAPHLFMDKVKRMLDLIVESATASVKILEGKLTSSNGVAEIRIDEEMRNFAADVISEVMFGRKNSVGKEMFVKIWDLKEALSNQSLYMGVPGRRLIPTTGNKKIWKLERELDQLILKAIKNSYTGLRSTDGESLIDILMHHGGSERGQSDASNRTIVDYCKSLLFAGYENISTAAVWCLMLLSAHPIWQESVRAEVLELISSNQILDAEALKKMKRLTMVIQETLRLYPPTAFISREAFVAMRFGDVLMPKGTNLLIPVAELHHDPEIRGPNAEMFDPERFRNGINGACKYPHAYLPFGLGPRTCLGQNLAMLEIKVILSFVLSRFSFSLSSLYQHSPCFKLAIEPEHGLFLKMKLVRPAL